MIEEQPLRLDTPLVAQVSRWDRLKDPLGVLAGFAEHVDPADEPAPDARRAGRRRGRRRPRGRRVLAEVEAAWHALPAADRRRVHLALLPMEDADENAVIVNALQRRADVVVQKSLAEGSASRSPRRCGRAARSSRRASAASRTRSRTA